MRAHFISPRVQQKEAVKVFDFWISSQRFLVAAAQRFFQVQSIFRSYILQCFFKKFVGKLHRSLILDLFTTPGVNRKFDVRATTKRRACPGVRAHKGSHVVFSLFLRYCVRVVSCLVFCFCPFVLVHQDRTANRTLHVSSNQMIN